MALKIGNGLDLLNQRIVNVGDPTGAADAANKQYVDNVARGLNWKEEVKAATTTTLAANTYSAGGKTLTANANGALSTIDGVSLSVNDRVLVKDEATGSNNGIYTVTSLGSGAAPWVFTRAVDADTTAEFAKGCTVTVMAGTANGDKAFTLTNDTAPTLDSSSLTFGVVGGGQTYTAGNGLTGSTTFSVLANGTSIDVSSSGIKIADAAAGNGLGVSAGILSVNAGTGLEINTDNLRIATTAAGTGLTGGGGSALSIDTTLTCRRYSTLIGNGSSTAITVTHNLNTKDITWSIRDTADDSFVFADVVATSSTQATFTFATAPASNKYSVTITG